MNFLCAHFEKIAFLWGISTHVVQGRSNENDLFSLLEAAKVRKSLRSVKESCSGVPREHLIFWIRVKILIKKILEPIEISTISIWSAIQTYAALGGKKWLRNV